MPVGKGQITQERQLSDRFRMSHIIARIQEARFGVYVTVNGIALRNNSFC